MLAAGVLVGFGVNWLAPPADARATSGRCSYGPYTVKPASNPGDFVYSLAVDLGGPRILSPLKVQLQKLDLDGGATFYVTVDSSFTGQYWEFDGSAAAHGESPAAIGQQPPGFSRYHSPSAAAGQLVVSRFIRFAARWDGAPGPGASATYLVNFC
jgi:hypothetical protein